MPHKKLYVPGELAYHWQPFGVGIPIKSRERGKAAIESFFLLMFSMFEHGYIQKEDVVERLENYSKTMEVIKDGYKGKIIHKEERH